MIDFAINLLGSGFKNLASYLAAHVLLCLLPAFLIAGAMTALIPKEIITRFLGRDRPKMISYPASASAGFLLAVCSCTVIPLFAGIYKKGAGLGPAITFLFVAPAVNIMAISYTGKMIGMDLAIARFLLAIIFGISIGLIMAAAFYRDDLSRDEASDTLFSGEASMGRNAVITLLLLLALLVVGTFQIAWLKTTLLQISLPLPGFQSLEDSLRYLVPFDPSKGEEGVTAQGAILIAMLGLIGITAWKGIENIFEGQNPWTWGCLILVALTLLVASLEMVPTPGGLALNLSGKTLGVLLIMSSLGWMIKTRHSEEEVRNVLWESWRFVKQIFPLLLIGVFAVGIIREVIQPQWIQTLAGENTLSGNIIGVVFGVFMYFPTLVEVPVAQMFLDLGMHRGPLLAYLLSDPELSLQSILITVSIIGRRKAMTYVGLIALFSTLAGLLYGAWVNQTRPELLALALLVIIALLAFTLLILNRRNRGKIR